MMRNGSVFLVSRTARLAFIFEFLTIDSVVAFIFLLDILQTVFATHAVWGLLILGWGDASLFAFPPWTAFTFPVFSGISECCMLG
jgi:hypothetical protein